MAGDRAANIKRARELRALGITYEEVSRRLALEGIYFGARHLSTLCRDVPCPQLRGRPKLYSREKAARRKKQRKQRLARAEDLEYNGEQNGGDHE